MENLARAILRRVRDKLCDLLAWEKQYAVEEKSFKDRIRHALRRIENAPYSPEDISLVVEGFGAWCLAESGGRDLLAIQRISGEVQVYDVLTRKVRKHGNPS